MLVFWGENRSTRRKNLSEQGREPATNSTHIWYRARELNPEKKNPGHIGGRRALSPLRHSCSPLDYEQSVFVLKILCTIGKINAMQAILHLLTRIRVFASLAKKRKRLLAFCKDIVSISPALFVFGSLSLFCRFSTHVNYHIFTSSTRIVFTELVSFFLFTQKISFC